MDGWETRLAEEIRAYAARHRSMSAASKEMGFARNYISQFFKDEKFRIELPSFLKAIDKLGHASALYILFGTRTGDTETTAIIDAALALKDEKMRGAALLHIQGLQKIADQQAQPSSSPD